MGHLQVVVDNNRTSQEAKHILLSEKVLKNRYSCKINARCVLLFIKPFTSIIIKREIMTRRELNVHCKYPAFQTRIWVFLKLTEPSTVNHLFNW